MMSPSSLPIMIQRLSHDRLTSGMPQDSKRLQISELVMIQGHDSLILSIAFILSTMGSSGPLMMLYAWVTSEATVL